jgi:nucleoside-diphosphate-sugar epimerase
MGRNVLVTGTSGFIGRYLAEYLVQSGNNVVGVDIAPPEVHILGVKYEK